MTDLPTEMKKMWDQDSPHQWWRDGCDAGRWNLYFIVFLGDEPKHGVEQAADLADEALAQHSKRWGEKKELDKANGPVQQSSGGAGGSKEVALPEDQPEDEERDESPDIPCCEYKRDLSRYDQPCI